MLKIKIPATTSNLSVGFDTLGLALDLYNEFHFEASNEFVLEGFEQTHMNNNLVLQAYLAFCKDFGMSATKLKRVKITLASQEIPIAKGLGSSASCIIAGVIAANHFNHADLSLLECANYASKLEQHPDNVYSATFGGLNATYLSEGEYINESFEVSNKLSFAVLIPDKVGRTEELREILPNTVPLKDAVFHLSRMIHLPKAFASGDFFALRTLLQDRIHEMVRSRIIPQYEFVKTLAMKNQFICSISGSGPSLFLISTKKNYDVFKKIESSFLVVPVHVSKGMTIENS